jgi:hypothetical protein
MKVNQAMDRQHPHFGASYKIVRQTDNSFAVEVTFPIAPPVNMTGFASEQTAAAWVADHEREVATGMVARAKFRPRNEGGQ